MRVYIRTGSLASLPRSTGLSSRDIHEEEGSGYILTVVCTVLSYVHAVTFRAAMRDNTLDHDDAPPGQFFDTEYHLERHQSTCNHYPILKFAGQGDRLRFLNAWGFRYRILNFTSTWTF